MCRCEPGGSERKLVMLVRWRQQVEAVVGAHPASAGWRAKVWMEKPCEPAGFWREVKANLVVVGGGHALPRATSWGGMGLEQEPVEGDLLQSMAARSEQTRKEGDLWRCEVMEGTSGALRP